MILVCVFLREENQFGSLGELTFQNWRKPLKQNSNMKYYALREKPDETW